MTSEAGPTAGQRGPQERDRHLAGLVQRSASGDHEAFAAFYDDVAPVAYGLARKVVRDADLAADVTQEALMDVWRSADRFDAARGSVIGWVCSITHRRAVDLIRSTQASRDREQRAGVAAFDRAHDDVAERNEAVEDRDRVNECLGTLTELEYEAVTAAYYGGQTYREVAEGLGAKLATVKSRMRSALQRLQDCLGVGA
ncbi:sigma-70 family RNA polymerase sigma factor [Microbacterium sp. A93]|uniref:sigma-70 family RNA polymerase sigma factor n=1 Tax=Microbacterium sp. A93 TaxID=3450716 RepID=UPI003F421F8D